MPGGQNNNRVGRMYDPVNRRNAAMSAHRLQFRVLFCMWFAVMLLLSGWHVHARQTYPGDDPYFHTGFLFSAGHPAFKALMIAWTVTLFGASLLVLKLLRNAPSLQRPAAIIIAAAAGVALSWYPAQLCEGWTAKTQDCINTDWLSIVLFAGFGVITGVMAAWVGGSKE